MKRLPRRAFLGGSATAIGLPFLDAMLPKGASVAKAADTSPRRLVFVHVPNGMIRTGITPKQAGINYEMPYQLESIADLRSNFLILTGLHNKPGSGNYTYPDGTVSNDGPGDHARDTATFLTATRIKKTAGDDFSNGISVDQEAAGYLKKYTPDLPSMQLSASSGGYGGDSGYGPVYQSAISWAGPTTPLDSLSRPSDIFGRLFMGFDPDETEAERIRRQHREQSVLDSVLGDIHSLESKLGPNDRMKLDEYLSSIRHLETRLQASGALSCDPGSLPQDSGDFEKSVDQIYELIKLAFACDRTRVISLMLRKGGAYDFLSPPNGSPITRGHHTISHLVGGDPDVAEIEVINRWQIQSFGKLLRAIASATDGDGQSALHNSLVLFGGGLDGTGHDANDPELKPKQSGAVHRHNNLPILLGGQGGGTVRGGRHIDFGKEGRPIADLYLSMLHSVGHMAKGFGLEGTAPISELAG
ncbi:MAG: DUF1552 domain-containing protein [Myxococcales bacterium]|nr:DUF1552 domain-containing protein [Myxococcales bacterium]